jgi:hypothetical protein
MAGVAVRKTLQIILMLGLGFPERSGRLNLGDNITRPKTGRIDIGDGFFRDPLLLVARVEDGRTVARALIVTLTILRAGIMNLGKRTPAAADS